MKMRYFPINQFLILTLLIVGLSVGLYSFKNPKIPTSAPASTEDPSTFFVIGIVHDEKSGLPLSGVRVSAKDSFATTNARGEFTLILQEGIYLLDISKDGYVKQAKSITIGASTQNEKMSITLAKL